MTSVSQADAAQRLKGGSALQPAAGRPEVSVLVPRRQYTHVWHRLLHDRTADAIAQDAT